MATFLKFLNGALDLPGQKTTQYLNPTATGWSAQVTKANTWLVLAPTAATAAGTITLPSGPVDQSEVLVTSTQAITALTVASAEDAVVGAPTSLPANGYFTMRFDDIMKTWRRVG